MYSMRNLSDELLPLKAESILDHCCSLQGWTKEVIGPIDTQSMLCSSFESNHPGARFIDDAAAEDDEYEVVVEEEMQSRMPSDDR
jgi:hypothetical protein